MGLSFPIPAIGKVALSTNSSHLASDWDFYSLSLEPRSRKNILLSY